MTRQIYSRPDERFKRSAYYYKSGRVPVAHATPGPGQAKSRPGRKQLLIGGVLAIIGVIILTHSGGGSGTQTTTTKTSKHNATSSQQPAYSTTDPVSLAVVVNKQHPLSPLSYAPPDLVSPNIPLRLTSDNAEMKVRPETAKALETMAAAASQQGIKLDLESGYRSYDEQVTLYDYYVRTQGQSTADEQSARPGYSEHQTGLAADIGGASDPTCNIEQCFENTPEGKWLAANVYKYGFIVRYTADKVAVTGYEHESWHIRYVGIDLSTKMHSAHIETLEEYFHVSGGAIYK